MSLINTKKLAAILLDYLVIFACVFPFAYAAGQIYIVIIAAFASAICTLHGISRRSHTITIALGMTSGFIISLVLHGFFTLKFWYWQRLEVEFLVAFCVSFIVGMVPYSLGLFFEKSKFLHSENFRLIILTIGILLLGFSIANFIVEDDSFFHIALVQGINFGLCIGLFYSVFIRDWLLPILNILNILLDYMRAMFLPMSAFFVGYFLIILTFTGIYGTLSLIDITAFKGINLPWKFSEYVYYSIVSITTLGTANIKAYSELAKIMTSIEVLMGLMWTTVVLAATIAYLQKTFSKLAEKHSLFGNRWK